MNEPRWKLHALGTTFKCTGPIPRKGELLILAGKRVLKITSVEHNLSLSTPQGTTVFTLHHTNVIAEGVDLTKRKETW